MHLLPSLQPCSSATSVVTQQEKQLKNTERERFDLYERATKGEKARGRVKQKQREMVHEWQDSSSIWLR